MKHIKIPLDHAFGIIYIVQEELGKKSFDEQDGGTDEKLAVNIHRIFNDMDARINSLNGVQNGNWKEITCTIDQNIASRSFSSLTSNSNSPRGGLQRVLSFGSSCSSSSHEDDWQGCTVSDIIEAFVGFLNSLIFLNTKKLFERNKICCWMLYVQLNLNHKFNYRFCKVA